MGCTSHYIVLLQCDDKLKCWVIRNVAACISIYLICHNVMEKDVSTVWLCLDVTAKERVTRRVRAVP